MTSKNASAASEPATSLTDKEREAIAQMPYEEARDKLIQAVQALEAGGLNLDQSMRQWEIGEALAKRAQSLLNEARPARRRPGRAGQQRRHRRHPVQPGLTGHPTRDVAPISARHGEARANLWTENTRFAPICARSRHLGEHLWTQRWRAETIYVPICVVTHRRSATHRRRTTRHPSSPDAYHNMTTSP